MFPNQVGEISLSMEVFEENRHLEDTEVIFKTQESRNILLEILPGVSSQVNSYTLHTGDLLVQDNTEKTNKFEVSVKDIKKIKTIGDEEGN